MRMNEQKRVSLFNEESSETNIKFKNIPFDLQAWELSSKKVSYCKNWIDLLDWAQANPLLEHCSLPPHQTILHLVFQLQFKDYCN